MSPDQSDNGHTQPLWTHGTAFGDEGLTCPGLAQGLPTSPLRTLGSALEPSPERPSATNAFLSELTGPRAGRQMKLGNEVLLGRGTRAYFVLGSSDVSRAHARISLLPSGEFLLEDLSSKNGTRVNGELVTSYKLQIGDHILLGGETLLLFSQRTQDDDDLLEGQRLDSLARLSGGIAHDFNNLLMIISGNVDLLRMHEAVGAIDDPDVAECLDDARHAAGQARDLVRQLLGFARRGRWEERPVEVTPLLEEVAELLSHTLDPRISVSMDLSPDLWVTGDRAQLYQMLLSLCLNSRDSMPSGGRLVLSAHLVENPEAAGIRGSAPVVHIRVEDSGTGMDETTRRRVFEPFFTTKKGPGRGLGLSLAVVHGVVTGHGGEVWVESEPRRGSVFHVAFPALSRDETPPAPAPEPGTQSTMSRSSQQMTMNGERRLVLVVDDDELVRRGIARLLRAFGFIVEMAPGGEEALGRYPTIRDQLAFVLLDLVMPGMDGQEVLSGLLKLDPEVRVAMMSGHHDEATVELLVAAGARAFLRKPFEVDELRAVIAILLA